MAMPESKDDMIYSAVTSFNAGELSPKMIGRTDVSQYSKGCRKLENFFVTPYGAVERRPGTVMIAGAKSAKCRLIKFVFSADVAYVCEFGDKYIRFFRDRRSAAAEIPSPYSAAQLADLKFVQSADVMTIVHPDHAVRELRRTAENSFTLAVKDYQYPPMLEPNIDDDFTLKPSAVTGNISVTASKAAFTTGNIGGFFQLIHTRKESKIEKDFTADGSSPALEVFGNWTFTTHGTWTGNIVIERSFDNGATWYEFQTFSSAKDNNVSTSGSEEEENVLYRITMQDYEQSDTGTLKMCRALLVNPDFITTGIIKIISVSDEKNASATVIRKLGSTDATAEWNEGAWSNRRGYPRTVAFFEERMIFGGTSSRPQTVWGSKTGDWDNFLLGDKDDSGLEFTLASDTVNTICWLCQHDALIIGTVDSEWTLSASDSSAALTPSNFKVRRQSVYGSAGIPGQMVGDTVLFVQRSGRKIREFVFNWEKNGYVSPDLTILAEHITAGKVTETALQQQPDNILWCVLNSGEIAALTYERDQEVVGWHRHTTAGKFISVCVVPAGDRNDVYFAVQRRNGTFIEYMGSRELSDIRLAVFADSAIQRSGDELIEIDQLAHLEGETVCILADGAIQTAQKVSDGKITLDVPAQQVTVGLPYTSIVSPMPIEIDMQNGSSQLRRKAVGELRVRVYDSVGGELRCGDDSWQQVISRDVLHDTMDTAVIPKTETVVFNMLSGFQAETQIELRQTDPLPFSMSSMVVTMDVAEK